MRTEQITSDDINLAALDEAYLKHLLRSLGFQGGGVGEYGFAHAYNKQIGIHVQSKTRYHAIKRLVRIICAGRTVDDQAFCPDPLYARPVLCDCIASEELRSLLSAHYVDRLFNVSIREGSAQ